MKLSIKSIDKIYKIYKVSSESMRLVLNTVAIKVAYFLEITSFRQAKKNMEKSYAVVGVLEELSKN